MEHNVLLQNLDNSLDKLVIYNTSGKQVHFSDFIRRIHHLSLAIQLANVKEGDFVSILIETIHPALEIVLGSLQVSVNPVLLQSNMEHQEIAYELERCQSKILFIDTKHISIISKIQKYVPQIVLIVTTNEQYGFLGISYEEFLNMAAVK